MPDLRGQLHDYVESTIERVDIDDVAAAVSARPTARPKPTRRRPVWVAAGAALFVILLIGIPLLFIGSGNSTIADRAPTTVPTTAVAPPTPQPTLTTTLPTSPDAAEGSGTSAMDTPPISATWTLTAMIDGGWLTEPVAHNGGFLARHKGLAEGVIEGWINPDEGWGGQLWESTDGVTWVPASDDQEWPPTLTGESMAGPAVIVEYEGNRATERVGRLLATSDGSNWREINLRPYEDNWIPRVAEGGLGWLVYSPPTAQGASWSGPRASNHGLWYSPNTEAWFEVADLGPLAEYADIGEVGVWDVAMIVRDNDILVFAYLAENIGFGNGSQHRTEIWQLEPGTAPSTTDGETAATTVAPTAAAPTNANPAVPTGLSPAIAEARADGVAFDFAEHDLCEWFTADETSEIVAAAQQRAGTNYRFEAFKPGQCDGGWASPGFRSSGSGDLSATVQIHPADKAPVPMAVGSGDFVRHRLLDDKVTYQIRTLQFAWQEGLDGYLRVAGHEEENLYFAFGVDNHDNAMYMSGDYKELGLATVNEILRRMNWLRPATD